MRNKQLNADWKILVVFIFICYLQNTHEKTSNVSTLAKNIPVTINERLTMSSIS